MVTLSPVIALLSTVGFVSAATLGIMIYEAWRTRKDKEGVVPIMAMKHARVEKVESFSHYVARQLGIKEAERYPAFCKVVDSFLRAADGWEEDAEALFANSSSSTLVDQEEARALSETLLLQELNACMLTYFAFHWSHASSLIKQALPVESHAESKLRNMVRVATRSQRMERVSKELKVTRVFHTLVEEIKAMGTNRRSIDVVVPAKTEQRSPVLLFMGGGMGAGKSTVLKDILKEGFWSEAAKKAVVVEADAFKETDVLFRELANKRHEDVIHTAELVHQSSTMAASSLLVTALNEGQDVIMDGTLSWEPFVRQTIAMARNVHRKRYRMGVGYMSSDDGSVTEKYWEEDETEDDKENCKRDGKPYRIELVGVVCDAHLAVVRGIRRAIIMGRAVRVKSQLISHKMFATNFPKYIESVDHARLYCTNEMGGPPKMIAMKDGKNNLLVDEHDYGWLKKVSMLNENAESVGELYNKAASNIRTRKIWERHDTDLSSKKYNQVYLASAIAKTEVIGCGS